mgnify:FL=1
MCIYRIINEGSRKEISKWGAVREKFIFHLNFVTGFAPGPTLHCIFRHFCAFFPTFLHPNRGQVEVGWVSWTCFEGVVGWRVVCLISALIAVGLLGTVGGASRESSKNFPK